MKTIRRLTARGLITAVAGFSLLGKFIPIASAAPPAGYSEVWRNDFNAAFLNTSNWTLSLKDDTKKSWVAHIT
jgi:hypothetical protein